MSEPDRERDELDAEGPAVLPEREAMWILSQAPDSEDESPSSNDQSEHAENSES